jgi:hypothetical protein
MNTFTITFDDMTVAEAGQQAVALQQTLRDAVPEIKTEVKKADPNTMDAGSILQIILGSASVLALATGISNYLLRTRSAKLVINGEKVIVENMTPETIVKTLETLNQRSNSNQAKSTHVS